MYIDLYIYVYSERKKDYKEGGWCIEINARPQALLGSVLLTRIVAKACQLPKVGDFP